MKKGNWRQVLSSILPVLLFVRLLIATSVSFGHVDRGENHVQLAPAPGAALNSAQHHLQRLRRRATPGPRPSSDYIQSPFLLRREQVELASFAERVGLDFAQCLCEKVLEGLSPPQSNADIHHINMRVARVFSNVAEMRDCWRLARRRFRRAREAEGAQRYKEAVVTDDAAIWPEDVDIWEFHEAVAFQQGRCLCGEHARLGSPIRADSPIQTRCYEEGLAQVIEIMGKTQEVVIFYNRPKPRGGDEGMAPSSSSLFSLSFAPSSSASFASTKTSSLSSASAFAFGQAFSGWAARARRQALSDGATKVTELPGLVRKLVASAKSSSITSSSDRRNAKRRENGPMWFGGGGVGSMTQQPGGSGGTANGGSRFVLPRGGRR